MSETEAGQSGHLPRTRLLFLLLHSAQLALAIAVLGLDSYGLLYVQYNVLIYSLTVVCNCHSLKVRRANRPRGYLYTLSVPLLARLPGLFWKVVQCVHLDRSSRLDDCFLGGCYWTCSRPCKTMEPARMHLHSSGRIQLLFGRETGSESHPQKKYILPRLFWSPSRRCNTSWA
jgi:hypothetical protein